MTTAIATNRASSLKSSTRIPVPGPKGGSTGLAESSADLVSKLITGGQKAQAAANAAIESAQNGGKTAPQGGSAASPTSPLPKAGPDAATAQALSAAPQPLAKGTLVDGVDCSGMTDDPKLDGIPCYLQTQNRKALSATLRKRVEQLAADGRVKANDPDRAKIAEIVLGKQPVIERSKAAEPTKEKTVADKSKAKGKTADKAKPEPKLPAAPKRKKGERAKYDWSGARERAEKGTIPACPDFSANTHKSYRPALAEVYALVKAGDLAGLQAYRVKGSSTSPNAIKKFREIALIALKAKKK